MYIDGRRRQRGATWRRMKHEEVYLEGGRGMRRCILMKEGDRDQGATMFLDGRRQRGTFEQRR